MKKFSILICLSLICISGICFSCGKKDQTPVDEYVEILDQATKKTEQISSISDLLNVQEIISPEAAMNILKNNADYQLTDHDKDKLKKSYDKLLRTAYEKSIEYGNVPQEAKEMTKQQIEVLILAANSSIDEANTLGDLNGM